MLRKLFYLVSCVVLLSIGLPAKADLVITNGDFEVAAGPSTPDVNDWYDNSTANFWENAWQSNDSWITPNGSQVVVFCSWNTVEGDPLAGSYLYQSIGTSSGEPSITISFDWGCPDDVAAGRHDALTVSVLASDGSFVADDANDVLGAAGITLLDYASYDYVALGTDGEIFPVVVTLDLSGANVGDEIFLRFNNYLPEAGADPWPVLDNVQIIDMAIGFGTPVIDGEVDDIWADAATAEFVPLEDPADGSGTWKALYDAENLYVLVDVTDDSLQNDSAGSWQDDSVEIYFDGGNTKLSTALSGDDHQYTFGWTTEEIQGTNITGYTDGIEHAQVDTDTGWRIEVKMPWMSIWGVVPQAGDSIGIDCYYNDDDDGGDSREGKMLGFSAIEGWNDASQWGTAVLAAKVKPKPKIAWVSYHAADDEPSAASAAVGFTQASDIGYTDLLSANGYDVTRVLTTQTPDVEYLNTFDLVIISRSANSGDYGGTGATAWDSVTAPMIVTCGYKLRSSRLGFTDGTDMPDTTGDIRLAVTDPTHPIFAGISITDGVMDNMYAEGAVPLPTDGTISRGISINNNTLDEEGTVLATVAEVSADTGPVGGMVIAELPAGATLQNSSGSPDDVLGGPRLVFLTGSREPSGVTSHVAALYDLYPDGEQMFLNAVDYMIPIKPVDPGTENLVNSWTFDDGTANDTVGDANGTLVGDAAVVDGQLVLDGDGDWMDMPGDVIAMNTFEGLTIEIQFTSVAGGNTGFHMVTAFGEEGTGDNPGFGYKYVCITPARGDNVSRAMIQTVSMDGDPWSEETGVSDVIEHDDGLPHHMVCTIDDTELAFYVDGVLIGTAALDPPGNSIAGIGTDVARIGKGVYGVDPLWAGSVDYLNLYNRALSEEEILFLAGK